ncbi:MAG: hypothetical protein FWE17_02560 [Alphaproteobacteria bacterium]|nr:hypothetical protein [Alphaproteobacteria bacterium]MCL2758231.1 hypothetical protein [Alphaproteobacteria bacterium]
MRDKISIFVALYMLIFGGAPASTSHLVENAKGAHFMDIVKEAQSNGAGKLILRNSEIHFNLCCLPYVMPVEIQGAVTFVLPRMPKSGEHILLADAHRAGFIFISAGPPGMFDTKVVWRDEDSVAILVVSRVTDYSRLLDSPEGWFLDDLRDVGAYPGLIQRLDAAQSMVQLYNVIENSVALRPARLMNPLRVFAMFSRTDDMAGTDTIFGDDLTLYSANAGFDISAGNASFGVSVRAGDFSNSGLEEFDGIFYGFDIRGRMDYRIFYAAANAGVLFANFQTGPVHDGLGGMTFDPRGTAYHGTAELGAKAFVRGGFHITPFVRAHGFSSRVLYDSFSEITFAGGGRMGYREVNMGIETEYGAYGLAYHSGGGEFGIRADINSPRDGFGVGLNAAVMDMDLGRFYKLGASIRIDF